MKSSILLAVVILIGARVAAAAEPQKVRFLVSGSYCMGCSEVLADTLKAGGVANASRLPPNRVGSVIVLGEIAPDADLGALAATVNQATTPHRKQAPPGLALEVFAKLDKQSAAKALAAVGQVPGVDAQASQASASAGTLHVKLTGDKPVKVKDVLAALDKAGIPARVVGDVSAPAPTK